MTEESRRLLIEILHSLNLTACSGSEEPAWGFHQTGDAIRELEKSLKAEAVQSERMSEHEKACPPPAPVEIPVPQDDPGVTPGTTQPPQDPGPPDDDAEAQKNYTDSF